MRSSLMLQGLWKAVEEKFSEVSEESKVELQKRAISAIFKSMTDNVLREIVTEKTASDAWKKLEQLYYEKSLTNRLYLKKSFSDGRDVSVSQDLMARKSSQKDNRSEGRPKSKVKTVSCFECHEKGHYKRDCPMLRKGKEQTAGVW